MGTWGGGPFDNDAAADFLDEVRGSPARAVGKALRAVTAAPAGRSIDVDDGGAAWAACELVALAFGHGESDGLADRVLDVAAKLKPTDEQRRLAVAALPRIADRATSELAGLWHDGAEGPRFDAALAHLRARLEAASAGPREQPKAKKGDVIVLPTAPGAADVFVVQVVGPSEVAVFYGAWPDDSTALAAVSDGLARRVPTSIGKLLRRGRVLGNLPIRRDLRSKKLYADETGALEHYAVMSASGGGLQIVSYEEARQHDLFRRHGEKTLLAVALGKRPATRVRTVGEREAELRARHAARWAARRASTGPGPFGDLTHLANLMEWMSAHGLENAVRRATDQAAGMQGYGRPNEDSERGDYAFAGVVALWRGTLAMELWPAELAGRLPAAPDATLLAQALDAARALAAQVLTPDAELRLIWDDGPDQGAELRRWVDLLRAALG